MNNLMVKEVDFNGGNLLGIQDNDGKVHMGVRKACQDIGLTLDQAKRQVKNIQNDLVLKNGVKELRVKFDTQHRDILVIESEFIPLWLAKISITPKMQQESPDVVQNLVNYQLKAKDVLAEAFLKKEQHVLPRSFADALRLAADQQEQIELMKPKVENYDLFMNGETEKDMNETAKAIGVMGRNKLFEYLRNKEVLMNKGSRKNLPYQKYIDSGHFKVIETYISNLNDSKAKTMITPKGFELIIKLLKKDGYIEESENIV